MQSSSGLRLAMVVAALGLWTARPAEKGEVSLLRFGRAGEGRDDTRTFQTALDKAARSDKILRIPATPGGYAVGPLHVPGNSRVVLERGVVIRAIPGFKIYDRLINIVDVSNVRIDGGGAELRMNKDEYRDGEWRHCLNISGASDVRITGLACNDSGGDGLYIGASERGPSRNVEVDDCSFGNNRRQGFSLTSGIGIRIRRCRFTNTRGTAPEAGIDLEPNDARGFLQDVLIEDCFSGGNHGNGVQIDPGKLTAASAPVSITVRNHRSEGNYKSGYFATYESKAAEGVKGSIDLDHCQSEQDGEYGAVASFFSANGPLLTFRDLSVLDANMRHTTYDDAAVAVKRGGGGVGKMGNVHFVRPKIVDTKGNLKHYFTFRDYSGVGFRNIEFRDPELRGGRGRYGLLDGREVEAVGR